MEAGELPADEQAMELLADRIDDILANKSRSRTARQWRREKRSYHRYQDKLKNQEFSKHWRLVSSYNQYTFTSSS